MLIIVRRLMLNDIFYTILLIVLVNLYECKKGVLGKKIKQID